MVSIFGINPPSTLASRARKDRPARHHQASPRNARLARAERPKKFKPFLIKHLCDFKEILVQAVNNFRTDRNRRSSRSGTSRRITEKPLADGPGGSPHYSARGRSAVRLSKACRSSARFPSRAISRVAMRSLPGCGGRRKRGA